MTSHNERRARSQQKKSTARLFAVQALFQMEAGDAGLEEVQAEFETHRFGAEVDGDVYAEGNLELFRTLTYRAVADQSTIDKLTDKALVAKWPIDRIDPTLRALFRVATAELLGKETPPKVAISEFVDVAKAFFPVGKEAKFVNAVLDHIAREINPEAFA